MTTMFTPDHEWINIEDHEAAVVGITLHAQEALGDVVFVDLPEVGRVVVANEPIAVVESVKAASDVYAPISGQVVEGNAALGDAPETVNDQPEGAGWFARIKVADPSEVEALMDRAAYEDFLGTL